MELLLTILSIFAIAGAALAANKLLHLRVCPVCAGIAGTWFLLLLLRELGTPVSESLLALLIGGSAVGIAYQLARQLPEAGAAMRFKLFFMPAGLIAGYYLVTEQWPFAAAAIVVLGAAALLVRLRARHPASGREEELERKLEDCCG